MSEQWYDGAFFNRSFIFRFGDCDCQKNASLYAVMKLLSELAGEDYERRGMGYECLLSHGQAMLISRMGLKFERMPLHMEKVVASTWERCVKGPYFFRDYEIKTESGELLVSGSSLWFLVDITSREVLRPSALAQDRRQTDPKKSNCPDCEKLKRSSELLFLGYRPVFYSDLDANAHVNNAVYGKIAMDYLPDELRKKQIRDFSINFFAETKLGDTLDLNGNYTDKGYFIQGFSGEMLRFGCEFGY